MFNHYPIGSVWKRRDEKLAVIISDADQCQQVRAIVANAPSEMPYLVYTDAGRMGRVSQSGCESVMDLIYRWDGTEVGDLLAAADAVSSTWERGDLAGAVRELEVRAKIVREAA